MDLNIRVLRGVVIIYKSKFNLSYYGGLLLLVCILLCFKISVFFIIANILLMHLIYIGYLIWKLDKKNMINFLVFLAIISVSLMIVIIINEAYKHSFFKSILWDAQTSISFYGSYLSFLGTFSLGYIVYVKNRNDNIDEYIINGKMLCSILDSLDFQMYNINNKANEYICYDLEWKKYYFKFSQLKFHYSNVFFEELNTYFMTINQINKKIENKDNISAHKIYELYILNQQCSINIFNILEVKSALKINAYLNNTKKELVSWKEDSKLQDLIKQYALKYHTIIENWIFNYLIKYKHNEIDKNAILFELIEWLLSNEDLKSLYKSPYDKRIINQIIFEASMLMNKDNNSRVNYIWNEYSLKKIDV